MRRAAVGLGAQYPAKSLRLLLTGPEGPRDLDGNGGLRKVDGEVGHLGHHQRGDLAHPERLEQALALPHRGLAGHQWRLQGLGELVELVEVLTDDQGLLARVLLQQFADHSGLGRGMGGESIAVVELGDGVDHPLGL